MSCNGSRHDIEGGYGFWGINIGQATAGLVATASSLSISIETGMSRREEATCALYSAASVLCALDVVQSLPVVI